MLRTTIQATLLAALTAFSSPVLAEGERAGSFDYYVMALSWSSGWCALEGDRRNDPQCDKGRGLDFVLHGLWPQFERGWPSYCRTGERDPSRRDTAAQADLFGGAGQAFYQWKKHGRCAGLSAAEYFKTARAAVESVKIPEVLQEVDRTLKVPASVIEAAFLEANPKLKRDQVTVTCRQGHIQEVKVCLTKDLEPRRCGADVIKDCTLKDAILEASR